MADNRLRIRAAVALLVCLAASSCGESGGCDPADVSCSDRTAPTVVSVDPPNGATNVARLPSVTVTFSEPVAAASFTAGAFVVGSATGTISVTGSTATFTPSSQLPEGALHAVRVEGVEDLAGHALATAFTSSFTTRFEPLSAIAGPDQDVNRGASVHLDASGSSATGATLAWTQLGGPAVGPLSGSMPTFTAPQEVATVRLELAVTRGAETKRDTVVIWVLEAVAHTWWVSAAGNDANAGTRAQPMATIQAAVDAAHAAGNGGDVYVGEGLYSGSVVLRSRVSIYGGFDPATWVRDVDAHRPVLQGGAVAVHGPAESLFVEGLEIRAADAVDAGASSVALHLHDSRDVVIRRNVIVAGAGAAGSVGARGANGATGSTGGNGNTGGGCIPGSFIEPGAGGASFNAGGAGGGGRVLGGDAGIGGTGPAGSGGSGASDQGAHGGEGFDGGSGTPGESGSGGAAFGTIGPSGYAPSNGTDATDGTNGGGGGGGGGAGGFIIAGLVNACGPSGGGGGGGGQRSRGGTAGGGGGASIGVLLTGTTDAEAIDNNITTSPGGAGGAGGAPGFAGDGGAGGFGRAVGCDQTFPSFCTGASGSGGKGGRGGDGGLGGGGGGGPSIGVLQSASSSVLLGGNVFTLGAAGAGGLGGNNGSPGQRAEHLTN